MTTSHLQHTAGLLMFSLDVDGHTHRHAFPVDFTTGTDSERLILEN